MKPISLLFPASCYLLSGEPSSAHVLPSEGPQQTNDFLLITTVKYSLLSQIMEF